MKQFDYCCKIPDGKINECIEIQNEFIEYCKENNIKTDCHNSSLIECLTFYTARDIVRLEIVSHDTACIPLEFTKIKEISYEKMIKKINKFIGKENKNELNIENFGKELVKLFNKYGLENFEVNSYINDYPISKKHQINIVKKSGDYTEGMVSILSRDLQTKRHNI